MDKVKQKEWLDSLGPENLRGELECALYQVKQLKKKIKEMEKHHKIMMGIMSGEVEVDSYNFKPKFKESILRGRNEKWRV